MPFKATSHISLWALSKDEDRDQCFPKHESRDESELPIFSAQPVFNAPPAQPGSDTQTAASPRGRSSIPRSTPQSRASSSSDVRSMIDERLDWAHQERCRSSADIAGREPPPFRRDSSCFNEQLGVQTSDQKDKSQVAKRCKRADAQNPFAVFDEDFPSSLGPTGQVGKIGSTRHGHSHVANADFRNPAIFCRSHAQALPNSSSREQLHKQLAPDGWAAGSCSDKAKVTPEDASIELLGVPPQPARFECSTCHKSFTRKSSVRDHQRSHTGVKPFTCTFEGCGQVFRQKNEMRRHEKAIHSEKKFVCGASLPDGRAWGCGSRFARSDGLLEHHQKTEKGGHCLLARDNIKGCLNRN